jgi:flagellar FliL protein
MAEEDVQETTTREEAPEPAPKKEKKGFLKILIIVLVVLGAAGAGGYRFYGKNVQAHVQKPNTEKQQEKVVIGPIIALEPFIINVSGDSSKFVKISVAMELRNEKDLEQAKKITPVIRDVMLSVLGTKTPDVFVDVNGRSGMKKELFDGVGRLFADGGLKAVYITDLVMQ